MPACTDALPFIPSLPIVYFNCDLVRAAGTDPHNLLSTGSDIIAPGKRIQAASGEILFNYATEGRWSLMALIESLGARVLSAVMLRFATKLDVNAFKHPVF